METQLNRRQVLKMLALGGLGSVGAGLAFWRSEGAVSSYFLVTGSPTEDLSLLKRVARPGDLRAMNVSVIPIARAPQDLSILTGGGLIDPTQNEAVPQGIADFAWMLRSRREPGNYLLTVEPKRNANSRVVVFERNGVPYDQIPLAKNYARIEVPGEAGKTVFRLESGRLSVVHASCRHELCRKMGPQVSGNIVCAPNRLVARMPSASTMLDAVTG